MATPSEPVPTQRGEPVAWITGLGLITPLGDGAWPSFRALTQGKRLTDRAQALPGDIGPIDLVRALGSVACAQHSGTDPAVELAERALLDAGANAGLEPSALGGMPVMLGMSKGAMASLGAAAAEHLGEPDSSLRGGLKPHRPADRQLALALGPVGYIAHHLHRRLGVDAGAGVVAACASGLAALHLAQRRMRDEGLQRVAVVSCEAALFPAFIHSYRRLGVLPPLDPVGYLGRPLDEQRSGFIPVEQAAALILQAPVKGQACPVGAVELLGSDLACDAHDLIRSDPAQLALRRIAQRLLGLGPWDLLHPHATGTAEHDPPEMLAYAQTLAQAGVSCPDVYANKGALGHGLGCSGLASLVIACLCARSRRRPPMPWIERPIDSGLSIRKDAPGPLPLRSTHAVFAAGFGGHVAGAVIRGG